MLLAVIALSTPPQTLAPASAAVAGAAYCSVILADDVRTLEQVRDQKRTLDNKRAELKLFLAYTERHKSEVSAETIESAISLGHADVAAAHEDIARTIREKTGDPHPTARFWFRRIVCDHLDWLKTTALSSPAIGH